jgi:hypothetical protein
MSNVYKILVLRLREYHENKREFIQLYGETFKKDILNEFNKISVNKANNIFDTINKNINNDNHNMIKKYQSIVKFIKSYKDNYNDELDIFVDDIKNLDLDDFKTRYVNFTPKTIEEIKKLKLDTIELARKNIGILISNNKTYNEILREINSKYHISVHIKINAKVYTQIHAKINALREINIYLLDLYFTPLKI